MSDIRHLIEKKKNTIDANQSHVIETTDNERIIENNKDKFSVTEHFENGIGYFDNDHDNFDARFNFKCRKFTVTNSNGNSESLNIELHSKSNRGSMSPRIFVYFGNNTPLLQDDKACSFSATDIKDTNQIRYILEDKYPQAAYFMDKFVIVTPEERKSYQEYVKGVKMRREEAKKIQKISENFANRR